MTIDELKKGEHETVEYKLDIPAEKLPYILGHTVNMCRNIHYHALSFLI